MQQVPYKECHEEFEVKIKALSERKDRVFEYFVNNYKPSVKSSRALADKKLDASYQEPKKLLVAKKNKRIKDMA